MNELPAWMAVLNEEDIAFLKRFLLASGSLKDVAAGYGISYPTVRLRLDRLIAKIQAVEEASDASEFEYRLRALFAEGRMDKDTFRELMGVYRKEKGKKR
ncbi:MAG TPA: DUF2089 family protein [Kiritimatiellia bacterium]|nr:DUF2089 family protein [Kiritimatiellia bacterium]